MQERREFDLDEDPEAEAEAALEESNAAGSLPWSGTDREYTYDELLGELVWKLVVEQRHVFLC